MHGQIRAIDTVGSAKDLGLGPWSDRNGAPKITTDRQGGGWAAAELYLLGRTGARVADAWLTSADLRQLAARAARIADWLDDKRTRACACDDGHHFGMIDNLCPQTVLVRAPYCSSCWSHEYGMTEHQRTDDERAADRRAALEAERATA